MEYVTTHLLRELDKAPGGNNLQYILKCPCIPFFGNQGLHNEIMLGGNGGRSGVICEESPYTLFHSSPSLILTLLNSHLRSIFVNTFLLPMLSIKFVINGSE